MKKKSQKKCSKKIDKRRMLIVLIILIIIILICIHIKKNNGLSNKLFTSKESTRTDLIDMNNTENAKIVDGEKVNTSDATKDKSVDGLNFTNLILKTENGVSVFMADIKNDTGKDFTESLVRISFKDKTGTIISDMDMTIPAILEGNTISVNAATTADVVNSKDIVIELVEQ